MHQRSWTVLKIIVALLIIVASLHPTFTPSSAQTCLAEVTINTDFNLIFIPVQPEENKYWMLMDTGAPYTVVEYDVMTAMNVEVEDLQTLDQPGGKVTLGTVTIFKFHIGNVPVELKNIRAAQMKRGGLDAIMGKDVLGILGFDFISQFTIEVDYQNNKLKLFDKNEYEYKGDGKSVSITILNTRPLIKGSVLNADREHEGTWLCDTGSLMFLGLQQSYVENNEIDKEVELINSIGLGFGGSTPAKVFRVDGFRFEDYVFENCLTGYSEDPVLASFPFDGVLGGEFFRRFTMVIDYERNRFILKPNLSLYEPAGQDRSGMMLMANGNNYDVIEIVFVHENSPAASAGIKQGDELIKINGIDASQITIPAIWTSLRGCPGKRFDFVIKRNGELIGKEMYLADYIK
jgi:hypothetical protein